MEAPLSKLLEHIEDSLGGEKEGTDFSLWHPTENGDGMETTDGITVSITTLLAGLRFSWQFQCAPAGTDMVQRQIHLCYIMNVDFFKVAHTYRVFTHLIV